MPGLIRSFPQHGRSSQVHYRVRRTDDTMSQVGEKRPKQYT